LCVFWQDYALSDFVVWYLFDQYMKAISLPSLNRRPLNKNLISFETYKETVAEMKFPFNYCTVRCLRALMKFLLGRFLWLLSLHSNTHVTNEVSICLQLIKLIAIMKNPILWNVTPCNPVVHSRFRAARSLFLTACFLGSSTFLRNVGEF
jgi:hypothetical protein